VAQVLLRHDGERHWLRAAPRLVGHLFPRLLAQSEYNTRLRVLPEPFPLVLGLQAAADLHLRRHRDRVQPREPENARRAGPGPPRPFPNWVRQRVEAVIWTLKSQLGLERHGGRIPAGL
jgi:hypothetical protein